MIKIGGELVGTQTIKSKGAYDERVNVEPNPTFENAIKGKNIVFRPVRL